MKLEKRVIKYIKQTASTADVSVSKGALINFVIIPPFELIMTILRRSLRYLGHVLRTDSERLVLKTLMAFTKGGTEYPPGSLFMDVEDIPFEEF